MSEHELRPHRALQKLLPIQRHFRLHLTDRVRDLQDPGALFAVTLMLTLSVIFIWIGL